MKPARNPYLRWLSVTLRAIHLSAVIALGAVVLGAPVEPLYVIAAVLASGVGMLAQDLWVKPHTLLEWSGAALMAKLLVVGWMGLMPSLQPVLFWVLVVWSVIFSHAPASFRHSRWWGGGR